MFISMNIDKLDIILDVKGVERWGEVLPQSLRTRSQQGQDMKTRSIMGIHDMGTQPAHTQALSYLIHWQSLQNPLNPSHLPIHHHKLNIYLQ